MPNYDWMQFANEPLSRRFPAWAAGSELWRSLPERPTVESLRFVLERLTRLRLAANWGTASFPCPRVFISHRKDDDVRAREIAAIATAAGFDWWLDVEDKDLQQFTASGGPLSPEQSLLIAKFIEMALLNSTHVLAVLTKNTRGSMWVPYEYGRVKDSSPQSLCAGCWLSPDVPPAGQTLPEYLLLGVTTRDDDEIEVWLRAELKKWQANYSSCGPPAELRGVSDWALADPAVPVSALQFNPIYDEVMKGLKRALKVGPPLVLRPREPGQQPE